MNLIQPSPINIGLAAIQRLGSLLGTLTASGPVHSLPPNVRSGFLSKANSILGETSLSPAGAAVTPIGRAAYGYLFRLPEDPEPFSRLVMPSNRSHSGTLEIQVVPGYANPLVVALYYVFPEADRPMLRHYIRLSSFFCGVSQTNAFAEVQSIHAGTEPYQALMLLLGAMETLGARPFSDQPPASETRAKRGPKPKTGTEP
ncbi:MAG TPA: hypothetical protein VLJ37_06520 [bacterium]|nr:hypothetical protein [bacterium]